MADFCLIMGTLGERIKAAAEKVGGLNKLADQISIPRRTLGNYVSGTSEPTASTLVGIADATDSDLEWLLREAPRPHLPIVADSSGAITLPRFDVRASAGAGSLVASEEVSEYFAVGRDWLRRNLPPWAPLDAVVGALENGGDSMEPTVRDGDLLMVVQVTDWRVVERGGIFVFTHHDRLHLKRLQVLMNGDLKIISDNKAYEPWLVPYDDIQHSIRLLGQVFFAGGKPRSY